MDSLATKQSRPSSSVTRRPASPLHSPLAPKNRKQQEKIRAILQPKLTVGQPNDKYEREADSVADRIVANQPVAEISSISGSLPSGGIQNIQAETVEEEQVQPKLVQRQAEEEEESIQTKLIQRLVKPEDDEEVQAKGDMPPSQAAAQAINSPSSASPMRADVRSILESGMGADLSGVRVHEGSAAHEATASIKAKAFTHKGDIWLGAGQSQFDLHLMAHETTHVVQQGAARQTASSGSISRTSPRVQRFWNPITAISDAVSDAVEWVGDRIDDAINYIKEKASDFVQSMPGYSLFTVVNGSDPITGRSVERNGRNFIEAGLDIIPNGGALKQKLEEEGALEEAAQWLDEQIAELDFSPSEIAAQLSAFWSSLTLSDATRLPTVMNRLLNIIRAPVDRIIRFATNVASKLLQIIKDYIVSALINFIKEHTTAYPLLTVILGRDPISGEVVERSSIALIRGFMQLSESGAEQLRQMEESGSLQNAADWLDGTVARLNLSWEMLVEGFTNIWNSVGIQSLLNPLDVFRQIYNTFAAPVGRIINFVIEVGIMVLKFIKDALISRLVAYARTVRGYPLLTVILGKDPFSDAPVERSAENIIHGFMSLMDGGEEQFQEMKQTGAIARLTARIDNAIATLNFTWEYIKGLFIRAWESFSLSDLAAPFDAFMRLLGIFGEPLGRLISFVGEIIRIVIEVVLKLMNFPLALISNIISKALQAFDDIKRDPIGFLKNLLRAVKSGFVKFFDNIATHLINGVTGWLFKELEDAGISPPADFSFQSILGFVLDVLGISVDRIFQKLAAKIGQDKVDRMRGMIDRLTGIWTFVSDVMTRGPIAIWEYIQEQLSNLWSTVLDAVKNWVVTRIIQQITAKLLSMLDPTGIMAVINGFIAFYKAIQSFIAYLREMLEIVNSFVEGVAEIARGSVESAANFLEGSLARGVPIVIGFLANQVGLGGLGRRIGEMIERVREMVDKGLDWLIDKAVNAGSALLNMGRNAVSAVTDWWRVKKKFTGADGKSHTVNVGREGGRASVTVRSETRTLQQIIDAESDETRKKQLQDKYNEINSIVGGSEPEASQHETRHKSVQGIIDQVITLLGAQDVNPTVVTHQTGGGSRAHRVTADPLTKRPGNTTGSASSGVQYRSLLEAIIEPTTVTHSTTNTSRTVFSSIRSSHLLAHKILGPAESWNLANTGTSINSNMRKPEDRAEALTNRGAELAYTTVAEYSENFPPDRATIVAGTDTQRRSWLRGIIAQSYKVDMVIKKQPTDGGATEKDESYGPYTDGDAFFDRFALTGQPPVAIEEMVLAKATELATTATVDGVERQRIPGLTALERALQIGHRSISPARTQLVSQGSLELIAGKYYLSLPG
ncbi:MAG: DUF4157 domain-containing protein [Gammaproteobacteria bacterium]|nr:DUF4157 domain-containing protein [Gammaproteobacteria bacterium]